MANLDITKLEETVISSSLAGKIILIYGVNRTGKSMVASQLFPGRTLFIATERGYNAISGVRKVDIDSWNDFRTVIRQLTAKIKKIVLGHYMIVLLLMWPIDYQIFVINIFVSLWGSRI